MIDLQYIDIEINDFTANTKWLENIINFEKKNLGEIVFIFCGDDYLLEKNIKYLKHSTLTDVITFDYCIDDIVSGDIFISIERVKENSRTYKIPFLKELDRVMIHGLLHLLGYNDKEKKESDRMTKKEDFYLNIK